MGIRKINFANGEIYHIYNRGADKRNIFSDPKDLCRFFQGMREFNNVDPIGSIFENSFRVETQLGSQASKLVNFVAYCLNQNHYHFILEQVEEKGIEKFMQRLGTGYSKYFNNRHKRSGVLFQGKFKSKHVNSNEYLLHLSVYVNCNNHPKLLGSKASKLGKSSWEEYARAHVNDKILQPKAICKKGIVLEQFKDFKEYEKFALGSLEEIAKRKAEVFDFES